MLGVACTPNVPAAADEAAEVFHKALPEGETSTA